MAKRRRPRDEELLVRIKGGQLVISIGVETLAHATWWHPTLQAYDPKADRYRHTKVTSPDAFAIDVVAVLQAEAEDGSTVVQDMLDSAIAKAVDDGSEHVEEELDGEVDSP